MKKFKEKKFGAFAESLGDPRTAIALASLGVGTAGLAINVKRNKHLEKQIENQKKQAREQREAMDRLTKALDINSKSMKEFRPRTEYIVQRPREEKKGFFRRLFSIEDGGYKGNKRTVQSGGYGTAAIVGGGVGAVGGAIVGGGAGVGVGAIIGAGLGALSRWMDNVADESAFNMPNVGGSSYDLIEYINSLYAPEEPDEDETTVSETETDEYGRTRTVTRRQKNLQKKVRDPKGVVYEIDADPRKCPISVFYKAGVMVLFINNPSRQELGIMNQVLDRYCYSFRNADYVAEQVNRNQYMVEVKIIDLAWIIKQFISFGIKINIITGNKLGIYKR